MVAFDRRSMLLVAASASLFPAVSTGAVGPSRFNDLHEPTELAWVIAALTPLGLASGDVIARNTDYFSSIESWFSPVKSHPLIIELGGEFNLPRFVGNASNFDFVRGTQLRRRPNSQPLWGDADGDLFTVHLRLIEDFAQQSRARTFLDRNRPLIESASADLLRIIDLSDIQRWLEAQFSARPRAVRLFVSPLTSGWNWTSIGESQPKIWVPAPRLATFDNPVERFVTIGTVFTEVDHNYVNPATATHLPSLQTMIARREDWGTPSAWENYETSELVFNEYMTWAVFLEYVRDRMTATDFSVFRERIVRFMQTRRGFVRFGLFADSLSQLRRQSNRPIEQLMDALISTLGSQSS